MSLSLADYESHLSYIVLLMMIVSIHIYIYIYIYNKKSYISHDDFKMNIANPFLQLLPIRKKTNVGLMLT